MPFIPDNSIQPLSKDELRATKASQKAGGFFQRLGEDLNKRKQNVMNDANLMADRKITPLENKVRGAGQAAAGIGDIASNIIGTVAKAGFNALPQQRKDAFRSGATSVANSRFGQAAASGLGKVGQSYNRFSEANPRLAGNLEAVGNIASVIPVGFGGKMVAKEGFSIVEDVVKLRNGFAKADDIIKAQVTAGARPTIDITKLSSGARKAANEAVKQGFGEDDVRFLMSMAPEDRAVANGMIALGEQANSNLRILKRPIDMAGETLTRKIKIVTDKLRIFGKAVDDEAKKLRGTIVNTVELRASSDELLGNLGIVVNNGKYNFSGSVFKMTPQIQATIKKFISAIPRQTTDAYQLHIFKKSIDELVNYGTTGEGLKGNAERLLKALRAKADDVLDTNFPGYNAANTSFKEAKDLETLTMDLFGKKNGIASSVRGGQVLRGAFSNVQSRARVYELAEKLDAFEKKMLGKVSGNSLDQALFAEIMEKSGIFSTQAITGFSGGIETAIKKAGTVANAIRNPISGALEGTASIIEKAKNIGPEGKRKAMENLLKGVLEGKKKSEPYKSKLFKGVQSMKGKGGLSVQDVSGGKQNPLTKAGSAKDSAKRFMKKVPSKKIEGTRDTVGKIFSGNTKTIKGKILDEVESFTEYAAKQKTSNIKEQVEKEIRARIIAEKLGWNPDITNWNLAKRFGTLLQKNNWQPKK